MDGLLFLAGLVVLAIPVSAIVALIMAVRLARRVNELEARVNSLFEAGAVPWAELPDAETEPAPDTGPWSVSASTETRSIRDTSDETESVLPIEDEPYSPPRAVVFRKEKVEALTGWLRENWFLGVAAVSLALSGIFLVQYGIENGLITPFWRVVGGLGLGAGLVAVGERLRRRFGDTEGDTLALPSTFAGAGLVVLFASILAARQLYGLIGPTPAFSGLVLIAVAAIVLGWLYGPFLSATGILGASAAPFLVGGSSDAPWVYMYYFALVTIAGLAIDTLRRWAWVSVLSLICGFSGGFVVYLGAENAAHLVGFGLIMCSAAILIPVRSFAPDHTGTMVLESLARVWRRDSPWPEFPTRLAFGANSAFAALAFFAIVNAQSSGEVWIVLGGTGLLSVMIAFWSRRAVAISDLALIGPVCLIFGVLRQSWDFGPLLAEFKMPIETDRGPAPIWQASWISLLAMALSATALLRSLRGGRLSLSWAMAAAITAPLVLIVLEYSWSPAPELGPNIWSLHPMAVAALMAAGALLTARDEGSSRNRTSVFVLAALTMISFSFVILLTKTALTLALGSMVLVAAWLDRRFDMRPMMYFAAVGTVTVTFRLMIAPGYDWAIRAEWLDIVLAYAGSIALLVGAHRLVPNRKRSQLILSSAGWFLLALFANVILRRVLDGTPSEGHWGAGLVALVWMSSAANQAWRLQLGGVLRTVRVALAVAFALISMGFLFVAFWENNPLFSAQYAVVGPPIFDSLALAHLGPALLTGFVALRFSHLQMRVRQMLGALGATMGAVWLGLEIRRLWHGPDISASFVLDGEMYSYTLAMMLASILCLFIAFSVRSQGLRQLAVIGIGITIAKVFLLDTSGLAGLYRVASFLGLGLALAGLAWAVRQMNARWDRTDEVAADTSD